MTAALRPEWSKPGVILFASEVPANEEAFSYALAQAIENRASLVLFHACEALSNPGALSGGVGADLVASLEYIEPGSVQRAEARALAPLARRARAAGVHCRVVVRQGKAADEILEAARECGAGRIVVGTHARGHIGKLLIGSVAESVLRRAHVPVLIVGPEVPGNPVQSFGPRIVLCAVSHVATGAPVVAFAAEVADKLHARLIVQHVIRDQECKDVLARRCAGEIESLMLDMVPLRLRQKVHPQPVVTPGEPAQKLIDQSRALNADLIVMGAYGASVFSAISRHGVVYRVMAEAQCPVMTLSPAVLETGGARVKIVELTETYLAGVI